MTVLGRDAILAAEDLPQEYVETPEWGGGVWIRCLTAAERDAFEAQQIQARVEGRKVTVTPDLQNAKARLVVRCIVDEAGKRLFADKDAVALGAKSAAVVDRLYTAARRLSGMAREDDLAELIKNSDADRTGDSSSA